MQVYSYTRVSTQEQRDEGISLDAQARKIAAYCVVKEWELAGAFADAGKSAKNLKRPGLQELLNLIHQGRVEVLIVAKLDRLTRSVSDLDRLIKLFERRGVALVSLQETLDATTATGRLMMNLLASVSQWEREIIGERTRDAMQELKAQGKRYCYARFEEHPAAEALLTRLHTLRAQGLSYDAIAEQLNAEGVPSTVPGGRWYGNSVRRVVRRLAPAAERKIA